MSPAYHNKPKTFVWLAVWAVLVLVSFSACKSEPNIDWNSRIGVYSLDEAILEMGPPDKSTELTDGRVVADWYQGRGPSMGFGFGVGSYGGRGGVGVSQGMMTGGDERYLRLTFDDSRILREVERVVR